MSQKNITFDMKVDVSINYHIYWKMSQKIITFDMKVDVPIKYYFW